MTEEENRLLPAYLREVEGEPGRVYGTLSYNRRSKVWTVKGDPNVTEMCKRLFPGTAGSKRGEARFTAHARVIGDLRWLMLRFPLAVKESDRDLWEQALAGARAYALRRERAAALPERAVPPQGSFWGSCAPFSRRAWPFCWGTTGACWRMKWAWGKPCRPWPTWRPAETCLP